MAAAELLHGGNARIGEDTENLTTYRSPLGLLGFTIFTVFSIENRPVYNEWAGQAILIRSSH
jgi:hypothetical protein